MEQEINKGFAIELTTPKQVMQAFLSGHKLSHSGYCNGYGNDLTKDPEHYLYLNDGGYICEEDGAGVKTNRIAALAMRNGERWWIIR